jgi:hypothetical protein
MSEYGCVVHVDVQEKQKRRMLQVEESYTVYFQNERDVSSFKR